MTNADIAEEVRAFLLAYVHSYEQLETLILLHQHPERDWSAAEVGAELKISTVSAAEALQFLSANLLLERVGLPPLSYKLSGEDVRRIMRSLAYLYNANRLLVMQLMNANAIERVRTSALRAFADAFLIGGKKKDG